MELLTVKMVNTAVERLMNQELADLGLTYTQTTVIAYLVESSGRDICQKDIEYNLGLTHPTVSSILMRMEANGLVQTQTMESDRRYKKVMLTEKALGLHDEFSSRYQKVKKKLYDGISAEERSQLDDGMHKILKNAQEQE